MPRMERLPRAKHAIMVVVAANATTPTTRQTTKPNLLPHPRRKMPKATTKTPRRPQRLAVEVMSVAVAAEVAEVLHVAVDAAEAEAHLDASTMTSTCSQASSPEIT